MVLISFPTPGGGAAAGVAALCRGKQRLALISRSSRCSSLRRLWFNVGVVCFVVSFGVLVYMTFWLRYVEGIYLEWEVVCPNQLKLGAASGALAFVFLTVGLWPVYSLFTVAILGVVFFGGMMLTHFVPAC